MTPLLWLFPPLVLILVVSFDSIRRRGKLSFSLVFYVVVGYGFLSYFVGVPGGTLTLPYPFSSLPTLGLGLKYCRTRPLLALCIQIGLCASVFLIYRLLTWYDSCVKNCPRCGRKITLFNRDLKGGDLCGECNRNAPRLY